MTQSDFDDYSRRVIALKKGLATIEAACCLHKWDLASHETLLAQIELAALRDWLLDAAVQQTLDRIPLGAQG